MTTKAKRPPVFYRLKDKDGKWIDHDRAKQIVASFEGKAPDPIGKIHPPRTLFLRNAVGSAKGESGLVYDMTTTHGQNSPIVESKKTGKWFTLSWADIINLAVDAGIDKEG